MVYGEESQQLASSAIYKPHQENVKKRLALKEHFPEDNWW